MLQPWEEDLGDLAVIGPIDSRIQELETTRFPWNTVVHLCRDFGQGCAGCSGILIAPDRVLTAAHCLWSVARSAPPNRIYVIPGRRDRRTMPYGSFPAREYWAPRGFIEGPKRGAWDYGVIVLQRPVTAIRRFAPLRPLSDAALQRLMATSRVTVAGYPSDRPVGTMWRHTERLVRADSRRLYHTVDTCPGHSGSPILAKLDGQWSIIGVHTAGLLDPEGRTHGCRPGTTLAPPGSVNSGARLTPEIADAVTQPQRPRAGPARMVRLP